MLSGLDDQGEALTGRLTGPLAMDVVLEGCPARVCRNRGDGDCGRVGEGNFPNECTVLETPLPEPDPFVGQVGIGIVKGHALTVMAAVPPGQQTPSAPSQPPDQPDSR